MNRRHFFKTAAISAAAVASGSLVLPAPKPVTVAPAASSFTFADLEAHLYALKSHRTSKSPNEIDAFVTPDVKRIIDNLYAKHNAKKTLSQGIT